MPAELAAWLKELALDAYGPRLVADHKIAFLRDVRFMEEKDLTDSGMGKIEAKRFVAAAAKLGATQRISGAVVEAAAVTEDPKVQEKAAEAARLAAAKAAEAEAGTMSKVLGALGLSGKGEPVQFEFTLFIRTLAPWPSNRPPRRLALRWTRGSKVRRRARRRVSHTPAR